MTNLVHDRQKFQSRDEKEKIVKKLSVSLFRKSAQEEEEEEEESLLFSLFFCGSFQLLLAASIPI